MLLAVCAAYAAAAASASSTTVRNVCSAAALVFIAAVLVALFMLSTSEPVHSPMQCRLVIDSLARRPPAPTCC